MLDSRVRNVFVATREFPPVQEAHEQLCPWLLSLRSLFITKPRSLAYDTAPLVPHRAEKSELEISLGGRQTRRIYGLFV